MANSSGFIKMAVGALVVAIVAVSVILPLFHAAEQTTGTFTNDGVFNYGVFDPTDTYTLVFDKPTGTITVNGVEVTPIGGISATEHASYTLISSDNVLFRFSSSTAGVYFTQVVGKDSSNITVLGGDPTTATISDGALDVTYKVDGSDVTKTFDFTEMYAIVPDSDEAVLKASSSEVYIKGDSEIYASGLTTVTTASNAFHFEGTYDDGITISSPNLAGATFDNIEWNIEPVDGYEDLYKLTSIEFDIIYNDTTTHATYSYFAVPASVTADMTNPPDGVTLTIIQILPVLVLVGVLMMVVTAFISNRRA